MTPVPTAGGMSTQKIDEKNLFLANQIYILMCDWLNTKRLKDLIIIWYLCPAYVGGVSNQNSHQDQRPEGNVLASDWLNTKWMSIFPTTEFMIDLSTWLTLFISLFITRWHIWTEVYQWKCSLHWSGVMFDFGWNQTQNSEHRILSIHQFSWLVQSCWSKRNVSPQIKITIE